MGHFIHIVLMLILFALVGLTAHAADALWQFDDAEKRARFLQLTEELRCPKCQNQNLADSDAPIAEDLREEIYRLIKEGESDSQVKSYLVDRYGEYILYRPQWSGSTVLLWLAPAILLMVGLFVIIVIVIQRREVSIEEGDKSLSEAEQAQLKKLLANSSELADDGEQKQGD